MPCGGKVVKTKISHKLIWFFMFWIGVTLYCDLGVATICNAKSQKTNMDNNSFFLLERSYLKIFYDYTFTSIIALMEPLRHNVTWSRSWKITACVYWVLSLENNVFQQIVVWRWRSSLLTTEKKVYNIIFFPKFKVV